MHIHWLPAVQADRAKCLSCSQMGGSVAPCTETFSANQARVQWAFLCLRSVKQRFSLCFSCAIEIQGSPWPTLWLWTNTC